ncbi:MAG: hypothetical protein HKN41_10830 [Ilumatobacter sp.]|nr:hypothetical protein [Ilumatobacter sp.]
MMGSPRAPERRRSARLPNLTHRRACALLVGTALAIAGCSSDDDATSPASTGDAAISVAATAVSSTSVPSGSEPTTAVTNPTATTGSSTAPTSSPTSNPAPTLPPDAPTTTTTTTITTTTTNGLTDEQLADRQLARTALITLDVFPEGWTEQPDVTEVDDEIDVRFERRFDECLGRDGESLTDRLDDVEAESGDFTAPGENAASVQHSVTLAPDPEVAIAAMSEIAVEGAAACLELVIQDFFTERLAADPEVPADLRVGDVTIVEVDTGEAPDSSFGYEIEIPLELGEQRSSQFLELLFQRRGRALSSLQFSSFGSPFDRDGFAVLSQAAASNIEAIGA